MGRTPRAGDVLTVYRQTQGAIPVAPHARLRRLEGGSIVDPVPVFVLRKGVETVVGRCHDGIAEEFADGLVVGQGCVFDAVTLGRREAHGDGCAEGF